MLIVNKTKLLADVLRVFLTVTPHPHHEQVKAWVKQYWMERYVPSHGIYSPAVTDALVRLDLDGFCIAVSDVAYDTSDAMSWPELQSEYLELARLTEDFPQLTAGHAREARQICANRASRVVCQADNKLQRVLGNLQVLNIPCLWTEAWEIGQHATPMNWKQLKALDAVEDLCTLRLRECAGIIVQMVVQTESQQVEVPDADFMWRRALNMVRGMNELEAERADALADAELAKNHVLKEEYQRVHVRPLVTDKLKEIMDMVPRGLVVSQESTDSAIRDSAVLHKLVAEILVPPDVLHPTVPTRPELVPIAETAATELTKLCSEFNPPVETKVLHEIWSSLGAYATGYAQLKGNRRKENRKAASAWTPSG